MKVVNARKEGPTPSPKAEPIIARKWLGCFVVACVVVLATLFFGSPASAAQTCGGTVPCSCGYTVIDDRILSKADFSGVKTCPGDGLIIGANGVALDLNGKTIKGSGTGVGIRIDGRAGVSVIDGRIDSFEYGVKIGINSTDVTINDIQVYHNAVDGLLLEGDHNFVIATPGRHNGNNGMTITGNDNHISEGNNEYNGQHGFFITGAGNTLSHNDASENAKSVAEGHGIMVSDTGDNTKLEFNKMTKLNHSGIVVDGAQNVQLTGNLSTKQRHDGIRINADGAVLINNKATENRDDGILVAGTPPAPFQSKGNSSNQGACIIYGVTGQGVCTEK